MAQRRESKKLIFYLFKMENLLQFKEIFSTMEKTIMMGSVKLNPTCKDKLLVSHLVQRTIF